MNSSVLLMVFINAIYANVKHTQGSFIYLLQEKAGGLMNSDRKDVIFFKNSTLFFTFIPEI